MPDAYRPLKNQILKTGLVPIIILTAVFIALSSVIMFNQTQANFTQQARVTTEQISLLMSSALSSSNDHILEAVSRTSLQLKGLYGLRLINETGKIIHQAGPPLKSRLQPDTLSTRAAELQQGSSLITTTFLPKPSSENKGYWLELEFDKETVVVDQYQWLLLAIACSALSLLLGTVAFLRLANMITGPLSQITDTIGRIDFNSLKTRIPPNHSPDFNPLSQQINALLERMQIRYRDMKEEVDLAAHEIQRNMETLEINNAELDLSRKRAIEANHAKSLFLANMSHEMRTPLNSISGYTELLKRTDIDDIQREHLRTLSTAADSLLAIIDDILDFAKLEAGKLHLENAPLNFRQVVDDVLAMNSPAAQRKNLELAAIFHTKTPVHLTGDGNRLKQIISNLLSNAIKFTENGSVIVQVMCEGIHNQRATLRISVEDTGVGISGEYTSKLFKAFSQVNSSRNRNSDGTGLGLAICKSLVEQMQGMIDFDSHPGKGSRFWFTVQLPLDHFNQVNSEAKANRGIALLQEARPWSRQAITGLLQEQGFQVHDINSTNDNQQDILPPAA